MVSSGEETTLVLTDPRTNRTVRVRVYGTPTPADVEEIAREVFGVSRETPAARRGSTAKSTTLREAGAALARALGGSSLKPSPSSEARKVVQSSLAAFDREVLMDPAKWGKSAVSEQRSRLAERVGREVEARVKSSGKPVSSSEAQKIIQSAMSDVKKAAAEKGEPTAAWQLKLTPNVSGSSRPRTSPPSADSGLLPSDVDAILGAALPLSRDPGLIDFSMPAMAGVMVPPPGTAAAELPWARREYLMQTPLDRLAPSGREYEKKREDLARLQEEIGNIRAMREDILARSPAGPLRDKEVKDLSDALSAAEKRASTLSRELSVLERQVYPQAAAERTSETARMLVSGEPTLRQPTWDETKREIRKEMERQYGRSGLREREDMEELAGLWQGVRDLASEVRVPVLGSPDAVLEWVEGAVTFVPNLLKEIVEEGPISAAKTVGTGLVDIATLRRVREDPTLINFGLSAIDLILLGKGLKHGVEGTKAGVALLTDKLRQQGVTAQKASSLAQKVADYVDSSGVTRQDLVDYVRQRPVDLTPEPTVRSGRAVKERALALDPETGRAANSRIPHQEKVSEGLPLTPKELERRIDAIIKISRRYGVPIFTGAKSKHALAEFDLPTQTYRQGRVRVFDPFPKEFGPVLAHEVAHAIDSQIRTAETPKTSLETRPAMPTGTPLHRLFDLPKDVTGEITTKLKQVTHELEAVREQIPIELAAANIKKQGKYYYRREELFARFMEALMFRPHIVMKHAPDLVEALKRRATTMPILRDYLDVAFGKAIEHSPMLQFLPDRVQAFIKSYGHYLGTAAYYAEVAALARMAKVAEDLSRLIKEKFKGVKDDPALLFKVAEAISENTPRGIVFGTKDVKRIDISKKSSEWVERQLASHQNAGWREVARDGDVLVLERQRYTAQEGRELYDSLSPEGKRLIEEYTADVTKAKDLFSRHAFAQAYNIKEAVEGWVHHFWTEKAKRVYYGTKFGEWLAALRRKRAHAPGFEQDLKQAIRRSYVEEAQSQIWSEFVHAQIARLAEPVPQGQTRPRPGYVLVQGNPKTGFKPFMGDVKKGTLWEVPRWVFEDYFERKLFAAEVSQATKVINAVNQYWTLNQLLAPGSVVLNAISGALQLVPRLLEDMFLDLRYGETKRTLANFVGLLEVLTPRGWYGAPDWVIGGRYNTFVGQFQELKSPLTKAADVLLYPFSLVDRFFKKAIAQAERRKVGAKDWESPELITAVTKAIDYAAYNYANVPRWLRDWRRHPAGAMVKPYATFYYKHSKQLLQFVGGIFDPNQPMEVRVARLFALATMAVLLKMKDEWERNASAYGKLPASEKDKYGLTGRSYVGKEPRGELWLRTAQYPFLNTWDALNLMVSDNPQLGVELAAEMLGGLGWGGTMGLSLMGFASKFDKFQPVGGRLGEGAATFVPFHRMFRDYAELKDAGERKSPEAFWQAFGRLFPTADVDLREKLAGEAKKTGRLEPATYEQAVLRLLTGINVRTPGRPAVRLRRIELPSLNVLSGSKVP